MRILPMDSPKRIRRRSVAIQMLWLLFWGAVVPGAQAQTPCLQTCGDLTGDGTVESADFPVFASCIGEQVDGICTCADLDGSGQVDLRDYALFMVLFGGASDETPPHCTGALAVAGDLLAHRPQFGSGYAPFARTGVPDAWEDHPALGPGIRTNEPGDNDPAGEDDLIEVRATIGDSAATFVLRRDREVLRVWTTRDRLPGSEIPFDDNRTGPLPFPPGQTQLTLWVEWASTSPGVAELHLEPIGAAVTKDVLVFHNFQTIVLALGGEGQVPTLPLDPNQGTFVVATLLYGLGYDVHMYDEDNVSNTGAGPAYDEAATAIQARGVSQVAIFGYSHGGGSTYDLADRLDLHRAALGVFEIVYTSYVDSVSNDSDLDVGQELRRPPSTRYHLNHYQHGTLFEDFFLDGGPVPSSNPPPTGLDVETTAWGAGSTHFQVDDFPQVRDAIEDSLVGEALP